MEALESRCLLSAAIATPAVAGGVSTSGIDGYTPSQVLHAYGFDALASALGASGGTGAGQTIAIVDAGSAPATAADLRIFDTRFNIKAPPSFVELNQNGGSNLPGSVAGWSLETALDVEWAHAVAPDADIVLVDARSAKLGDLLTAVDTARNLPGVSAVSMSWGVDEFPGETQYDGLFTTPPGHENVTFVAAAGDTTVATGVQWPGASPNVVSVGGTTLTITPTSNATESPFPGAASGPSQFEPAPTYQSPGASDSRSLPDVVYNANPVPGFAVYDAATGGWQTLGGSSAGAPQWAALVVIANQVRADTGHAALDGKSQTLPALHTTDDSAGGKISLDNVYATASGGAAASVALTSAAGAPQAVQVVTLLASTSLSATAAQSLTTSSLAGLLRRRPPGATAVPLYLGALIRLARPAAASAGGAAIPRLAPPTVLPLSTAARVANSLNAGIESSSLLQTIGPASIVTSAASRLGAVSLASLDSFTQSFGTVLRALSGGGVESPVPVDTGQSAVFTIGGTYLAHVNIGGIFCDAMAAFISESADPEAASLAAARIDPARIKAWSITVAVALLDTAMLIYLVRRSRRGSAQSDYVRWWEEPAPAAAS